MPHKLKLAVEDTIVDKIPSKSPLWKTATTGFRNVELTAQELADHINLGHPLCAQHQGGRSQANFLCSDIVAADIDDGMRLDEALTHPYVQQHAAILYTTPSHTDENHRFRIIFALPRTIADAAEMRAAYTGLIRKFGGDKSCKDACRLFFGSKGSDPIVLGNVMTIEALDELLLIGQEKRVSDSHGDRSADRSQNHVTTRRSGRTLELDQEVTMRNGKTLPLSMMYVGAAIHCPVHIDRNPSAFVVENRHGIKGVHCMACAASFWPPSAFPSLKKIDFYRVEGIVREQEYEEDPAQHYDEDDAPPGLMEQAQAERRFFTFSRQYLSDLDDAMFDGVTFLRSPKGTGKTEQLKKVVDWCKKNGLSVLLAGHRQTLLDSMADRLGMTCYMSGRQRNNEPDAHYAICLDSIGKLLKPDMHKYDVVLLDEAEQVINHLTGDTMRGKRRACMLKLFHYMQVAKSVIVSDADLGDITIEAICQIMNSNTQYRFFMNTYKESRCPFYLYENDKHLITNMVQTIKTGGRHYVATNSKKKAEMLAELIRKECGDDRRVLLVTSDTTKSQEVSKLLHHIKTEILNYDVVIASPTMGTGIDITFDDKAQLIDTVFGLFEARINTHFDIDQQLSRVRHPKEIKVWVSPQPFSFETDPCVIRRELIENGELSDALQRIKPDGTPELDETYLSIYATVTSISRASKNRLKKNLAELRTRNGWNITLVELDDDAMEQGKDKAAQAKGIVEARRIAALCSAKQIESERYQELKEKGRRYQYLSQDEDLSMRRHEIEAFYRTDISPELVELDDHGAYRDKVRLMQTRMLSFETAKEQAIKERDAEKLASDREHPILKKKMLHELLSAAGVEDAYGTILTDVDLSNDTLGEFSKICKNKASMMQELFGICVRKDVEKKPIRQLGDILDLVGLQTTQPIRRKAQGKTTYIYKIDGDSLNLIKEIIERRVSNPNQAVPHWKPLTAAQEAHARKKEEEEADRKKNAIFG